MPAPFRLPELPGYGRAVDFLPDEDSRFPVLVGDKHLDWKANTLLVREFCMLRFIEELSNKPEWWRKVYDPDIAGKWKAEAMALDWAAFRKYGDFTSAMADACINELKYKADLYEKTALMPVFDYSACAIKSDRLIPDDLWQALKEGVAVLEDVPEEDKDLHPGSDRKVLDLVHPSIWPLVYGRTRILTDRRISVDDALDFCGGGKLIPEPQLTAYKRQSSGEKAKMRSRFWESPSPSPRADGAASEKHYVSTKFQWLPCDVEIVDSHAKIASYINNLHPVEHAALYPIVEQFIDKALPAWDVVYRWPTEFDMQRLETNQAKLRCRTRRTCRKAYLACTPKARPTRDDEPRRSRYEGTYSDSEISSDSSDDDDIEGKGQGNRKTKKRKGRGKRDDDEAGEEGEEDDNDEGEEEEDDDAASDSDNQPPRKKAKTAGSLGELRAKAEPLEPESEYETEDDNSADQMAEAADGSKDDNDGDADMEDDGRFVSAREVKRRDFRWFDKTHPVVLPEPGLDVRVRLRVEDVKAGRDCFGWAGGRLQVIVKMASIHLTPDKPSYDGGSWHVEGQLNEHICATALFYYDCENVAEGSSRLEVRTAANRDEKDENDNLMYEQYEWRTVQRTLAIGWPGGGATLQDVGSVLTRGKRALVVPNVYQHRVAPFRLADPTRPGHRKLLALFLVDPAVRVISTANVPPQQMQWWRPEQLRRHAVEEAHRLRADLMAERSVRQSQAEEKLEKVEWNFCEH